MVDSFKNRMEIGFLGEKIIKQYLEDTGYIVYETNTTGAHWCDYLCHDIYKQDFNVIEVKTKDSMDKYQATGINIKALEEYQRLQNDYNLKVKLFFVDAKLGSIYYSDLSTLLVPFDYEGIEYPNYEILKRHNIVLFPLCSMADVKKLTEEEVRLIKELRLK